MRAVGFYCYWYYRTRILQLLFRLMQWIAFDLFKVGLLGLEGRFK